MHRCYHSCSMHPTHLDCTPTSLVARPVAREGGSQTPSRWLKVHILRLKRYIFLQCGPIECRKSALLRSTIATFPQGNMPLDTPWTPPGGRAPLMRRCLDHEVWKGPVSDKCEPLPSRRLATGLLAAMLSVCTCSGTGSTGWDSADSPSKFWERQVRMHTYYL